MKNNSYIEKLDISKTLLWKGRGTILGRLDIELTERCNNNCIHCCINLPADDSVARDKELSTAEIKNILKEAASLGCLSVRFTGGEPLLREDFEELYIFSRKSGLKVILFTNATLITKHLADLFSRIPPLEKIEVSVYGVKKESYEGVTRSPGSFAAAQRGIKLLLEKKIPFVVKGALLPYNKDEIEEFKAFAKKIPGMDKPPSYSMFFDLRCRPGGKKNEAIKKLRATAEQGLEILTRRKDEYLKGMKEFCSKFIGPSGDKLFSCGGGCNGGCVDAYGKFQLCMMLRAPDTVYNLRKGSLKEAMENFFPRIREIKASSSEYLKRCARCFLKGLCEQCPAKSWTESGILDTPVEYLCEIAHSQARFLGLLSGSEYGWEVINWQERIANLANRL
ncbi:radical SAM protein [bacterium]|nr:MAG: radical SAM protein [bacterium]